MHVELSLLLLFKHQEEIPIKSANKQSRTHISVAFIRENLTFNEN